MKISWVWLMHRRVIDELIEPTSIRPTDFESIRLLPWGGAGGGGLSPPQEVSTHCPQWENKLPGVRLQVKHRSVLIKIFHLNISTSILLTSQCNTVYHFAEIPITVQLIFSRALQSSCKVVEAEEWMSYSGILAAWQHLLGMLCTCYSFIQLDRHIYIRVYTITGPFEQSTDMSKVALLV